MGEAAEVEISRLGAQGDGIGEIAGEPVFVPFALPGERWRVGGAQSVRLTESPERCAPICRHFGLCGGCIAQHMSESLEREWKRDIVVEAFAIAGSRQRSRLCAASSPSRAGARFSVWSGVVPR